MIKNTLAYFVFLMTMLDSIINVDIKVQKIKQ